MLPFQKHWSGRRCEKWAKVDFGLARTVPIQAAKLPGWGTTWKVTMSVGQATSVGFAIGFAGLKMLWIHIDQDTSTFDNVVVAIAWCWIILNRKAIYEAIWSLWWCDANLYRSLHHLPRWLKSKVGRRYTALGWRCILVRQINVLTLYLCSSVLPKVRL